MEFGDGFPFAVVDAMFKREDYKQTKHDPIFTKWQVLIGSNDWEDFRNGKDGATRYRVQNLPCKSCPGLYELGVGIIGHDQARQVDSHDVLVAYLGQAESVRSRLQCYGRSGAHLKNVNLTCDNNGCELDESLDRKAVTAGLFEDIFSKGGSILYRWAPMKSKREAEVKEVLLLGTFDYAWNKGSNGERRHQDLLEKLGHHKFMSKRTERFPWMHVFSFAKDHVGVKIKGEKHILAEERELKGDTEKEKKSSNLLSGILKLSRNRPQPVSDTSDNVVGADSGPVCGVILKDGTSCTKTPVKGRKRCTEHKGERICRVSPKPSPEKHKMCEVSPGKNHQESDITCGVILVDGETCSNRPVSGRKRCESHKGMRINAFLFLLNHAEREKNILDQKSSPGKCSELNQKSDSLFCEAITKSGSPCTRSPSKGSRRCWQHKERMSKDETSPENISPAGVNQVTCGVKLYDGSVCEGSPVKGRKRCELHKGMRITS
ncbi:PREDICTED: protein EFFECTOR OF TRANSCRIPTION 2 [Tarenaya hassleriana]|uniref:protein EFFECTOR OF TRANSCRIPTION 2 n=1 Tax=Tarenaya hassleriana TaxID=28532 RepID=UPI00053CA2DB|nr:PREDICTED: protein EFFECTOR OF TRANSCRIPTION 2 [Tarenaya hassleriana]